MLRGPCRPPWRRSASGSRSVVDTAFAAARVGVEPDGAGPSSLCMLARGRRPRDPASSSPRSAAHASAVVADPHGEGCHVALGDDTLADDQRQAGGARGDLGLVQRDSSRPLLPGAVPSLRRRSAKSWSRWASTAPRSSPGATWPGRLADCRGIAAEQVGRPADQLEQRVLRLIGWACSSAIRRTARRLSQRRQWLRSAMSTSSGERSCRRHDPPRSSRLPASEPLEPFRRCCDEPRDTASAGPSGSARSARSRCARAARGSRAARRGRRLPRGAHDRSQAVAQHDLPPRRYCCMFAGSRGSVRA